MLATRASAARCQLAKHDFSNVRKKFPETDGCPFDPGSFRKRHIRDANKSPTSTLPPIAERTLNSRVQTASDFIEKNLIYPVEDRFVPCKRSVLIFAKRYELLNTFYRYGRWPLQLPTIVCLV